MLYLTLIPLILLATYAFDAYKIYQTQTLPSHFEFQTHAHQDFFAEQSPEFMRYHQELLALGFQLHELISTQTFANIINYIASYRFPEQPSLIANITSIRTDTPHFKNQIDYLEFHERFADQSMLTISNAAAPSAFPRFAHVLKLQLPDIHHAKDLLAAYQRARQNARSQVHALPALNSTMEAFNQFNHQEAQALIQAGYLQPQTNEKGKYRITYSGAFRCTWRALLFLSKIGMKANQRAAQKWIQ